MTASRPRRLTTAAATAVALLVPSLALAAPAQAGADVRGYYKTTWDSTLYYDNGLGSRVSATYGQWAAAGFPAPRPAVQTYTSYSWSPVVYRTTAVPSGDIEVDRPLTAAEWAADGRPAPRPGSGRSLRITQWNSSDELFADTPDGRTHKLTPSEWDQIGRTPPQVDAQGFIKLTWSDDIAFGSGLAWDRVDGARWAGLDLPTPRTAKRFPTDLVYQHAGSPTVYYSGPTMSRAITYAEWVAAGSPAPVTQ